MCLINTFRVCYNCHKSIESHQHNGAESWIFHFTSNTAYGTWAGWDNDAKDNLDEEAESAGIVLAVADYPTVASRVAHPDDEALQVREAHWDAVQYSTEQIKPTWFEPPWLDLPCCLSAHPSDRVSEKCPICFREPDFSLCPWGKTVATAGSRGGLLWFAGGEQMLTGAHSCRHGPVHTALLPELAVRAS